MKIVWPMNQEFIMILYTGLHTDLWTVCVHFYSPLYHPLLTGYIS